MAVQENMTANDAADKDMDITFSFPGPEKMQVCGYGDVGTGDVFAYLPWPEEMEVGGAGNGSAVDVKRVLFLYSTPEEM